MGVPKDAIYNSLRRGDDMQRFRFSFERAQMAIEPYTVTGAPLVNKGPGSDSVICLLVAVNEQGLVVCIYVFRKVLNAVGDYIGSFSNPLAWDTLDGGAGGYHGSYDNLPLTVVTSPM